MIQFSQQQMAKIRRKVSSAMLERILKENAIVLEHDILVPCDNRATWNLFYFCPEHGVRLEWDRNDSTQHRCPIDGQIFTGEPYDGAWWRWLNGLNAKACKDLGLLWQITGQKIYLNKVKAILLEYAKYYPDYEEHGGIPYNGPGKANAQTLCEANCNLDFALGYDFVCDALSIEDKNYIEHRLLREGAEFLIQHRTDQLHNHEMKINATIGVVGLILNEKSYLDFALHSKYGMHYQLDHGSSEEGLWFEGSVHYHYYALQALLAFEKLARDTDYSVRDNPNYHKMLAFPLNLLLNSGDFPKLNDCIAGQENLTHTHLFEFAFSEFSTPIFASALQRIYQSQPRDNIDALLYGVDELPDIVPLQSHTIHAPSSGITLWNNEKKNHACLLKHAPYGGEHDHYDRLGLILMKDGKEILPDLGTTGYGAELHYGYYKNSATHNTLVVNQANQTPAVPELIKFEQSGELGFVDTLVDWRKPAATVDSHTLVHWDEDAYRDIQFRRSLVWLNDAVIEIDQVINPHQQQLDLTWHTRGDVVQNIGEKCVVSNPLKGPLERMKHCREFDITEEIMVFSYDVEQQSQYRQHFHVEGGDNILMGLAPDNPATSDLCYLLVRSRQPRMRSVLVHDLDEQYKVHNVCWSNNVVTIELTHGCERKSVSIDFDAGIVTNQ